MPPRVTVVSQPLLSHQKASLRFGLLFCHLLREVASTSINDLNEQSCQESPGLAIAYVCLYSLYYREGSFSETQLFVLCSDLRTARSVGYTGLILRETQLQLPVTASNKSTQHTYHTLRCRGPLRSHTPLYWGVRKGKRRDFATVSFRE